MKQLLVTLLLVFAELSFATGFTDLKFSGSQIADTQWNVGSCISSTSSGCQIYSKAPGPTYNLGYPVYPTSTQYIAFTVSGDGSYPWHMYLYNSNGTVAQDLGIGHILSEGTASDGHTYFFFSNANYNGTLFSTDWGMNNTSGITITGTMLPTVDQTNSFSSTGSTTPLASGQTSTATLCCGGSSAQFNANSTNVAMVQYFASRASNDSQVYISQIGDANNITVNQIGTKNNYVYYSGNGSNNSIDIEQAGNASTQANYSRTIVAGNSNTVKVTQTSTGGAKGAFINITDNNNSVTLNQSDAGSHYAEIGLTGGNKTIAVTQSGSASQMASIQLSGQPTSLTLQQTGATQNFYSIQFNCATAGGCAPISVKQGN
jgi:hypothetical protein